MVWRVHRSAFFAVNSRVRDVMVPTVSFTVHFTRPVIGGALLAEGRIVHAGGRLFVAESSLFDDAGQILGHGSGVFSRRAIALDTVPGY